MFTLKREVAERVQREVSGGKRGRPLPGRRPSPRTRPSRVGPARQAALRAAGAWWGGHSGGAAAQFPWFVGTHLSSLRVFGGQRGGGGGGVTICKKSHSRSS